MSPQLWMLVAVGVCLTPHAADARRVLVAVGENLGVEDDPPLRYAERDAERVAEVMLTVGGVDRTDATLLFGADAEGLARALEAVQRRLRVADGPPVEQLLVYISGHAADGMLHLRGSRYPIAALRDFVERAPVGLAMLVLDTCDAGRLTRRKGLEPLPTPSVQVERPDAVGRVYIAASAPGEAAYESERLEGALFTHHLAAGLRGAADRDLDGRVTLDEAFRYAYSGTLASAFGSARRQTPSYAFDLRGEGAVILTETGRAEARLAIDDGAAGEWVMLAPASGETLRLSKRSAPLVLAVTPGRWQARTVRGGVPHEAGVEVADGQTATITADALRPARGGPLAMRGSTTPRWALSAAFEVAPSAADGGAGAAVLGVGAGTRRVGGRWWTGAALSARGARQAGREQWEVEAALEGGPRWRPPIVELYLGLRLGAALVHQRGVPGGDRWSTAPRGGLIGGARLPLWRPVDLVVDAVGGAQLGRREEGWAVTPHGAGRLGLIVDL